MSWCYDDGWSIQLDQHWKLWLWLLRGQLLYLSACRKATRIVQAVEQVTFFTLLVLFSFLCLGKLGQSDRRTEFMARLVNVDVSSIAKTLSLLLFEYRNVISDTFEKTTTTCKKY